MNSSLDTVTADAPEALWYGDLPDTWDVRRLKHIVRMVSGGTPSKSEPAFWQGTIPWVSPKDMKSDVVSDASDHISEEAVRHSATKVVPPGSVLLVVRSGILQHTIPVATTTRPVALNQDLKALNPVGPVLSQYLAAAIRGHQKSLLTAWRKAGATVDSLEMDLVANTAFPVPPLSEQEAIVDFLDCETAKIDALIDQKQRLIELLQQKRAAVITKAVTKGLDPEVEMKKSGVEWLGSMPALWDQSQLGRLVDAISGGTPDRGERDYWEGDVPWVSPKDMKVSEIDDSEEHVTEQALRRTGIKLVQPPAVLLVVRGMILDHTVPVALITRPVTINQDMKALIPRHIVKADYLTWTLEGLSAGLLARVERAAHGTCKLSSSAWKTLTIPIPPEAEQRQICKHLRTITSQIDELIENIRHGAALLKEYRTVLISAAVTGKIDVREAAA